MESILVEQKTITEFIAVSVQDMGGLWWLIILVSGIPIVLLILWMLYRRKTLPPRSVSKPEIRSAPPTNTGNRPIKKPSQKSGASIQHGRPAKPPVRK